MSRGGGRALPSRRGGRGGPGARSDLAEAFGAPAAWGGDLPLGELPLAAIEPNPDQPRRRFDAEALERLAGSLRERGLLQPVLVRPLGEGRYALVAGERRWRAARLAGLERIPAYVRDDVDAATALELALTENVARQELSVVEEARALGTLIEDLGVTQDVLAARVGKSRSDLTNTLRLLDLPEEVLDLLDAGQLSKGHGKALLGVAAPAARAELGRRAAAERWSVRRLEHAVAAGSRPRRGETEAEARDPGREQAARALARRLERRTGTRVEVRPQGDGLSIRIAATDIAHAEAIARALGAEET